VKAVLAKLRKLIAAQKPATQLAEVELGEQCGPVLADGAAEELQEVIEQETGICPPLLDCPYDPNPSGEEAIEAYFVARLGKPYIDWKAKLANEALR
jgi:hypothetical protein